MSWPTLRLQSCPKGYTLDQDKACTPEQTLARFRERLAGVRLDILREVRRIDNGRLGIPVYFSVCGEDARRVIGNKKQMGKGSTPDQAQASACMELAERFSFFSFVQDEGNFLTGDHAALRRAGYPLLDTTELLRSVHDQRHDPALLEQLLADLPLRWVRATRLNDGAPVLVPFSWFFAINEFNGPSAGNTLEEALLQGLCEVVERDVCARVSHGRLVTPAIDPASVSDPVARGLLDRFSACGVLLQLRDFSLDSGIPTVTALAWDPATWPTTSEIVYTAGTTPDPTKSLIRALTEVAQLAGDFNSGANYVASGLPKPVRFEDLEYILRESATLPLAALPSLAAPDILAELNGCIAALARRGCSTLALETTHPALGIPAAYTIVPGAHFRERAGGGDAALFAAKLAATLLDGPELAGRLRSMEKILPQAYYLAFYRGRQLYDSGRPEEALPCFNRALELDPAAEDRPYIFSYQACSLRDLGLHQEAVAAAERGLAEDEQRPDLHNIIGVCRFKQGEHALAARHFSRAVQLDPASAIDHANLALNLQRLGRTEQAIEHYQVALGLDPAIEFARRGLAEILGKEA